MNKINWFNNLMKTEETNQQAELTPIIKGIDPIHGTKISVIDFLEEEMDHFVWRMAVN